MDVVLAKTAGGALVPVDQQGIDYIAKMKIGAGAQVSIKRHNNIKFHRKIFALANFAYDSWESAQREHRGQPIEKHFDQFREDITILAGFYETRVRLNGEIRLIAKSWAFGSMPDEEKDALYSAIINVVLKRILTNYTRADLDDVIEKLLRFT